MRNSMLSEYMAIAIIELKRSGSEMAFFDDMNRLALRDESKKDN